MNPICSFKWIPGSVALLSLLGGSLLMTGCGKKEEPVIEAVVRPVKILELNSGLLERGIELPGQIEAAREANMAFEVSGRLMEINVKEGQTIKEGEALARLDPRDFEATLQGAKATFEAAKEEADRSKALFAEQATSKQRLDMAVNNFEIAKSNLEKAQKAFDDTFLKAPFSGFVAKVHVENLDNVRAKQEIMIIHDISSLKITVDVPETLGVLAKPAHHLTIEERTQRARPVVRLTTLKGREFPAKVVEMSSIADTATRTYEATLMFDTPKDVNIIPGMTARLSLRVPRDDSLGEGRYAIPTSAVVGSKDAEGYVWVIDPDSMAVRKQTVNTVAMSGSQMEVTSDGLKDGDMIAISGVHQLEEGDVVSKFEK
ncbi:efflux RND transporter periplasmic adaptor subunit [Pelagicoccus mobilis]|uniref:Efflux RND transporter periplasmic adaptor subunit n=1 Tax=Pelagicoccus mobilis TaxID=415221 RepID=A0A934VR64_9BACT|nr:efflux RND transporter periplasmic adaptor subunit [Pelagicoccus mobilis]MBK1877610.1 efflux RND transporter periplasmic adaptor subunit [Pelagicoccus mobilis]